MTHTRLKVLMQMRPDYQEYPGGDAVQMVKTKAALESLGIEVGISTDQAPDLSQWDLIHAFNLTHPQPDVILNHCSNALRQRKPVVVSSIYWDRWEAMHKARKTLDPSWEPGAPDIAELARKEAQAGVVLRMADVLLPNSEGERDLLVKNFGIEPEKCVVVYNAVDEVFFDAKPDEFVKEYGLSDFVLCVGRLELRKNQHLLLAALKGTGLPVVLIGPAFDREYMEACRANATEKVTFIEHMPYESLPSAYAAARVHMLASWYDTPGLVSLEAAAAGCNIVSTDRGPTREYFKDMAWYCDPSETKSIRDAVLAAWEAPKAERLRQFVRGNYTWQRAAQQTLEGYEQALALAPSETVETMARRLSDQVESFKQYVTAQQEYFDSVRHEYERYVASLEESYKELEGLYRGLEETYRADTARLTAAIEDRNSEIEAIASRRLYRWSEWLALKLKWLLRQR